MNSIYTISVVKSNNRKNKKSIKIYLDYASGSLIEEANPSAIHALGVIEKNKLEKARLEVAAILGAHADEIIFTSGATEANNLAILGLIHPTLRPPLGKGRVGERSELPHIVTTNIEHASVLETSRHQGSVTFVAVESNGIVDPKKIKKALRPDTVLVSVMYANNEIGTIQPIREIAKEIRHFNKNLTRPGRYPLLTGEGRVRFHTDATQAMNYLPINVEKLGVDMMSFNAAKIYGPKGVGVLYKKRNVKLSPIMYGGDQEYGLRPGTENVAGALAIARALSEAEKIKQKEVERLTKLQKYFFTKLLQIKEAQFLINGDLEKRLPNNINITIPKIPSDLLVIELSAKGVMASAKSACKAGDGKASHVINAIRRTTPAKATPPSKGGEEVDGSLRFSLGRGTTKADIDYTVKSLTQILTKLKKWYN